MPTVQLFLLFYVTLNFVFFFNCITGAAVKMELQPALDPRKQELLEARCIGVRVRRLLYFFFKHLLKIALSTSTISSIYTNFINKNAIKQAKTKHLRCSSIFLSGGV